MLNPYLNLAIKGLLGTMRSKIVVTKNLELPSHLKRRLDALGDVTYYTDLPKSTDEWFERCRHANIICTGIFGLNSEKLYDLKDVFISLPFVGVEFLDKKRAKERNIVVSNSPGCNKEAVAEWHAAMLLVAFRRLSTLVNAKDLPLSETLKCTPGLFGKKITILGTGHIGEQLGKICEALGMSVAFFRRGDDLKLSVRDADIIANCLSVTPESMGLLDRDFFFSLKKGSFFISSSRPQTYDTHALKEALDQDILWGAADDPGAFVGDTSDQLYKDLLSHPKMIVTPHIAWNTEYEVLKSNTMMVENIEAWLEGRPINLVE